MGYVVNSAIADPLHKATVIGPSVTLRGYAVGNQLKGVPVAKVEVSLDGGVTWVPATIKDKEQGKSYPDQRVFSWVLWELRLEDATRFADKEGRVRATVKCTDAEGTTQDKTVEQLANLKGLLNNS